jgi:hypothetical protein
MCGSRRPDELVAPRRPLARRTLWVPNTVSSFDLYKTIYSHVQGGFKSLQSLLRRTRS